MRSCMKLSWEDTYRACQKIADQIKDKHFDMIVPVIRGGMPPSVVLSELTGIKTIRPVRIQTRDQDFKTSKEWTELAHINYNMLVLDDIVDSGRTFDLMIKSYRRDTCAQITYSALVVNDDATPEMYDPETVLRGITMHKTVTPEMWVVFPWDKQVD